MNWMLLATAAVLLALNMTASLSVLRNPLLARQQRASQLLVVWLLPAVGAIICLAMPSVDLPAASAPLDRTAFVDSADAGGAKWDAPPGANLCGCADSSGGGDGAD